MRGHAKPSEPEILIGRAPRLGDAAAVAGWCAVWIALWELASALSVNFGISAWYPPAAVSLFLQIRYGPIAAIAVFAASLLAGASQWETYPDHHEVLGSLGHAAAYLMAATFYRRRVDRHRRSIRPRSIALLGAASLLGAALASAFGNLNIHFASGGAYEVTFDRLLGWMTGDFFGVISLCPLLLFILGDLRWSRAALRRLASRLVVPMGALSIALAAAFAFALIARGSDVDFRLVSVVGVGVYSVIVAHAVSPASAVIYLFLVAAISAGWLSTEVAPAARIEFAIEICTFVVASFAMIHRSMQAAGARAAAMIRRLRIRELSAQRDALTRRIGVIEAEVAQLAHEFKTPLGGIIGLLRLIEGGVASGGEREEVTRYVRFMRGCAHYLSAMVDDAFDAARIERGRFEPAITEFDLGEFLEDLALMARTRDGGLVAFGAEADLQGLRVQSDRNRLLQILINLVVNGVRYADRDEPVHVGFAAAAETVTISVSNASNAATKSALDAYIAGGEGVPDRSKGLGIGLPLVGRLAAGIGARLSTAVTEGVVTISVTVPRA